MTPAAADAPFTPAELAIVGGLTAVGLAASALLRPYDAASAPMAVSLTAVSAIVGSVLFWLGLKAMDVPPGRRTAGAVWATLPWNTLLLSQVPYIGFFLVPVEIGLSAVILRYRARVSGPWTSLPLTALVRIATLLLVYSAAPAVRSLFPWR